VSSAVNIEYSGTSSQLDLGRVPAVVEREAVATTERPVLRHRFAVWISVASVLTSISSTVTARRSRSARRRRTPMGCTA
jgi:hypothetical protein